MALLVAALAVVVALLTVLVAGLLRSHAEIIRGLHTLGVDLDPDAAPQGAGVTTGVAAPRRSGPAADRPPTDRPAADLVGVTPDGDARSVAVVGVDHPTLLAFLTSGCSTCAAFWEEFAAGAPEIPGGARLVIVTQGPALESPARLSKFAPREVLTVMSDDAWTDFEVPTAPYFAYVDGPSGRVVGEGAGMHWGQVVSLLEQSLTDGGYETASRFGRFGAERGAEQADRALLAAGITPGHPSLYGPGTGTGAGTPIPEGSGSTAP